ncbi:CAAX protease self-immunity [Gottschalkia purinilytica]|uniref:CAAX protease self-immunity n=1 Tax=Gottschalkia purinilytica TaxID=1503 RepID=A0A0L0W6G4_GOTPU|nr:CPBP family intramembrane glutamic endopeptidase [Gottschalkia purinilytica]KNF07114.1 CAAX protease self-immunity [Gottschalkia purinilytica]
MKSINLLASAIIQIILFSIIPFIWWIISGRKQLNFFKWLGIKKPIIKDRKKYALTFLLTILLLSFTAFVIVPLFVNSSNMATSQFRGQGISALIPSLIYAFLQTGFSEEIFFRGFLTKRLVAKFGFNIGNIIQGLLFGLVHGAMFVSLSRVLGTIIIILITGIAGYLMGWINEKQSDGSIISSWLLHGCANTIASIISMFNLL